MPEIKGNIYNEGECDNAWTILEYLSDNFPNFCIE